MDPNAEVELEMDAGQKQAPLATTTFFDNPPADMGQVLALKPILDPDLSSNPFINQASTLHGAVAPGAVTMRTDTSTAD